MINRAGVQRCIRLYGRFVAEEAGCVACDYRILQVIPWFPIALFPDECAGKGMTVMPIRT